MDRRCLVRASRSRASKMDSISILCITPRRLGGAVEEGGGGGGGYRTMLDESQQLLFLPSSLYRCACCRDTSKSSSDDYRSPSKDRWEATAKEREIDLKKKWILLQSRCPGQRCRRTIWSEKWVKSAKEADEQKALRLFSFIFHEYCFDYCFIYAALK